MDRKQESIIQPRLVGIADFMVWTGLGRNRAKEFGEQIGCRRQIGGRVVYDLKVASEYFDRLSRDD